MNWLLKAAVVGLCSSASGCASNAITLDTARQVSIATSAAITTSNEQIAAARENRMETVATIIASDGSCQVSTSLLLYLPEGDVEGLKPAPLCARDETAGRRGYLISKSELRFVGDDDVAPLVLLTAALADYSAAILKALDRPGVDVSAEIAGALEKAKSASGVADLFFDGAGDAVGVAGEALQSAQGVAVVNLLQFALELADEARRVEDVENHVKKNGLAFEKSVEELKSALETWNKAQTAGDALPRKAALEIAYDQLRAQRNSSFDDRVAMVRQILRLDTDIKNAPKRRAAVAKVLGEVINIHAELRRELRGEFSEEKRREIAKINLSRLLKAVGLLAEAAAQFGVL